MYRLTGSIETSELADLLTAERDGVPVVVKLFHAKTTDSDYARVITSVQHQLSGVSHAGLARVVGVGLVRGRLAIVRSDFGKYTLGQVMRRLSTREVRLPSAVALAFSLELLEVVRAIHEAGVVHGAITPGNVLVGARGEAGLADVGALVALQASATLRKVFVTKGRSSYRAPEISATEAGVPESDIYAVGAIIYELLTLHEASTQGSAVSVRQAKLPPPSRLVRALNSRIDPVVMRSLEQSPSRRFRRVADFADALRDVLSATGGMPSRDDLEKFVDELFPKDMIMGQVSPAPFTEPFELEPITGARVSAVIPIAELNPRAAFSSGAITRDTATVDGLPAIVEEADLKSTVKMEPPPENATVRMLPSIDAVPSWEAPEGPAPEREEDRPKAKERAQAKRVRVVEDFEAVKPKAEVRSAPPLEPIPQTRKQYAVPFKRAGDPEIPDMAKIRKENARRAKQAVRAGTFFLTATLVAMIGFWFFTTPRHLDALVSYLPDRLERVVRQSFPSVGAEPGAPGPPLFPVKLPDMDAPKPLPPTTNPGAATECFTAPKTGGGTIVVVGKVPVRLEVDGQRVCGAAAKVTASAGPHRVRVIEDATGREFVSTVVVEAGRPTKVQPVFEER